MVNFTDGIWLKSQIILQKGCSWSKRRQNHYSSLVTWDNSQFNLISTIYAWTPFHGSNLADISLTQFLFQWESLLRLQLVSEILESWPKTSVSLTRRDQNQSERPSGLAPEEDGEKKKWCCFSFLTQILRK